MHPDEVERHKPFGFDLRHDLYDTQGNRILGSWDNVINVGQPDKVYVRRRGGPVQIVATRNSATGTREGQCFMVDSDELLIALGELEGRCRCAENDMKCHQRRVAAGRD
jgi:hypothetical protein